MQEPIDGIAAIDDAVELAYDDPPTLSDELEPPVEETEVFLLGDDEPDAPGEDDDLAIDYEDQRAADHDDEAVPEEPFEQTAIIDGVSITVVPLTEEAEPSEPTEEAEQPVHTEEADEADVVAEDIEAAEALEEALASESFVTLFEVQNAKEAIRVTFTYIPENVVVKVYPEATSATPKPKAIAPEADGSWLLIPGSYTYSAEAEGYDPLVDQPLEVEAPVDEDAVSEEGLMIHFELSKSKVRKTGIETWEDLQAAIEEAGDDEILVLGEEMCAEDADGVPLFIPAGRNVTLDLNGFTISRNLRRPRTDGCVIIVEGSLTLVDDMGGGAITGGNTTGDGGGIYVAEGGSLTIDGVDISDNRAEGFGGGVYAAGSLTMSSGNIEGNEAGEQGGGVYFENDFAMKGGRLADNMPEDVCLDRPITISGDVEINNALITNSDAEYRFLVTGELFGRGIGLSAAPDLDPDKSVRLTEGLNGRGDLEDFGMLEKNGDFNVALNDAGEVVLGNYVEIVLYPGDGTTASQSVRALLGSDFPMPDCPFAGRAGRNFEAWRMADGAIRKAGEPYHVVEETSATAQWSTTWADLQTMIDDAEWSDTLMLPCDLTRKGDVVLTIPSGKKLTLDLAGHALDGAGTDEAVISVEGTLTLVDTVGGGRITGGGAGGVVVNGGNFTLQSGAIAGNTSKTPGGGVAVNGGVFIMQGGAITANSAPNGQGGGIAVIGGSFELRGGSVDNNSANTGGGIAVIGGKANLKKGGIVGVNSAKQGGGVSVHSGATLEISGSVISKNTADENGGGVLLEKGASVEMTGGEIRANTAQYGGGVYSDQCAFTVNGANIIENRASFGGGIAAKEAVFTLKKGDVGHNTADTMGGGLYIQSGEATLSGGSVSSNKAPCGGGAFMADAELEMPRNVIIDNTAEVRGGGLALSNVTLKLPAVACVRNNHVKDIEDNYWLQDGAKFSVTEKLSNSYRIYLSAEIQDGAESVVIANGEKLSRDNFICVDGKHASSRNAEGDVVLGVPVTVRFSAGKGEGTMADDVAVRGGAYTMPSAGTMTAPAGLELQGWKIIREGYWDTETKAMGYNLPITEEMLDDDGALNLEAQWGTGVLYVDENGTNRTAMLVKNLSSYREQGSVTLTSGWYLADGAVFDDRVTISGDVNIIVDNLHTTTMNAGILVHSGNTLTIWGEGGWERASGKLVAYGEESCAGIGGAAQIAPGTFIMHSGVVEAMGGTNAAGVGGGDGVYGGQVLIHGGKLTARGGESGAGIGGGLGGSQSAQVSIYGGTVYAYGGTNAAGIGGGKYNNTEWGERMGGNGAQVTIVGATVYAQGGSGGAGIGGGWGGSGGNVTISIGSNVTAVAGKNLYSDKEDDQAQAIGRGYYFYKSGLNDGRISLTDDCQIHAGDNSDRMELYTGDARYDACRKLYALVVSAEALPMEFTIVSEGVDTRLAEVAICKADDLDKTVGKAQFRDKMAVKISPVGEYNHYEGVTIAYTYHGETLTVEDYTDNSKDKKTDIIVWFDMPMGNVTITPKIKTDEREVEIRVTGHGNGYAIVDSATVNMVEVGKDVTIHCKPDGEAWFTDTVEVYYIDGSGQKVNKTTTRGEDRDNDFVFTMPEYKVTVDLTFREGVFYYNTDGVRTFRRDYHTVDPNAHEWKGDGKEDSFYYVGTSMTIDHRVTLSTQIDLILGPGVTLKFSKGLHVPSNMGGKLYLYEEVLNGGSSLDCDASGQSNCAGIGGNDGETGGTVVVVGGTVVAKGGHKAAGIGGGNHGDLLEYKQYRGTVTAEGGKYGAGIGGGEGYGGNVEKGINEEVHIYGGTLTATGGGYAAGIGGGQSMHQGGPVYIEGGNVTAKGGRDGAGIGGGEEFDPGTSRQVGGNGGDVIISGGTVTATGGDGDGAAGIGGGQDGKGGHFIMTGGTVTATGKDNAAGIGGQDNDGGDVDISGGWLNATGGKNGAGIGGADDHKCGTINITGGNVTAVGGSYAAGIGGGGTGKGGTIKITGGIVHAEGGKNAAGIGGGGGSSGGTVDAIYITGYSNVYAYGDYHAVGIGNVTFWGHVKTTLWLTDRCTVTAGDTNGDANRSAPDDKKWDYCFNYKYAEIINCDHPDTIPVLYEDIDADRHKVIGACIYCKANFEEEESHTWYPGIVEYVDSKNHRILEKCDCGRLKDDEWHLRKHEYGTDGSGICELCGYKHGNVTVNILPGDLEGANPIQVSVEFNTIYPLPPLPWDANGRDFQGWSIEDNYYNYYEEMFYAGDEFRLTEDLTIVAVWDHIHDGIEFSPWMETDRLPTIYSAKDAYYLINDMTLEKGWSVFGTMRLCLNGHTITIKNGDAIVIENGNLTIWDHGGGCIRSLNGNGVSIYGNGVLTLKGGKITGAEDGVRVTGFAGDGHMDPVIRDGAYIFNEGHFIMEGGEISDCGGCGVRVYSAGVFDFSGGQITGCSGSGVYMTDKTHIDHWFKETAFNHFTMTGGAIEGNNATNGGGVCVNENCRFEMSGGSITGNHATVSGGGVYVSSDDTFFVSGAPVVFGNTRGSVDNNIYLERDAHIGLSGALSRLSRVCVTTAVKPTTSAPVILTKGLYGNGSAVRFIPDAPEYNVKTIDGEAALGFFDTSADTSVVHFDANGGTGSMPDEKWPQDSEYIVPECQFTGPRGFVFTGWEHIGTSAIYQPGDEITDYDNFTLRAVWEDIHDGITFKPWTKTDELPTESGHYYLTGNVKLTYPWELWGLWSGWVDVHLCLNGYSISYQFNSNVQVVSASLSIYDHLDSGRIDMLEHKRTIDLNSSSELNLYGGIIGQGVGLYDGTFNMKGGTVHGVSIENRSCKMNLSGGLVTGNGIHVNQGEFTMTGGTITGCTNSGLKVRAGTMVTLSGCAGASITGNTWNGEPGNVYLEENARLYIDGALDESARFGVSTVAVPGPDHPVPITQDLKGREGWRCFSADQAGSYIQLGADGEAILTGEREVALTFDANGGSGSMPPLNVKAYTDFILPDNDFIPPENREFGGWLLDGKTKQPGDVIAINQAKTVKAIWNEEVTVTFIANGGSGEMKPVTVWTNTDYTLPECDFTAPVRTVFDGWQVDGVTKQPGRIIHITEPLTLTAVWHGYGYVYFSPKGGSGEMEPLVVKYDSDYELPECGFIPPENMRFKGWGFTSTTTFPHLPGSIHLFYHTDHEWTAIWEEIPIKIVSFEANGGSGSMEPAEVREGAEYVLPECDFTAPEYMEFAGWQVGEETLASGETITVQTDMTLKATWQKIIYTVSFDANGGSGTMEAVPVEADKKDFTLPDCDFDAPEYMEFAGWQAGEKTLAPGETITVQTDMTLKATWRQIYYVVQFDANGGSGTMDAVPVEVDTDYILPECDFTAPGDLSFGGWRVNDETRLRMAGEMVRAEGPIVLTAVWHEIHDGISFGPWESMDSLPEASGNYYLTRDVYLDQAWAVLGNRVDIKLCLNGHSIRCHDESAYAAITVLSRGKLSIYDHFDSGTIDMLTADHSVEVLSNGQLTLHGGDLVKPASVADATLDMKGGVLSGAEVKDRGHMTLSGGIVTRKGITLNGELTMTGGEIADCNNGGLIVLDGAKVTLSGDAAIMWNTMEGAPVNVYLNDGAKLNIAPDAPLDASARFGITVDPAPVPGKPVVITEGLKDHGTLDNFISDDDNYIIEIDDNGEVVLLVPSMTVTFDANGGSGTMAAIAVKAGVDYTLPECKFTAPENMAFAGWQIDDEVRQPGEAVAIAESTTLKATWRATVPTFRTHSLLLSGEIGVNFFMELPEIEGVDYADAYMEFTVESKNGTTTRDAFDPNDRDVNGRGYYGFTVKVNSIQMAAPIHAVFHYGDGQTVAQTYSVKNYIVGYEAVSDRFDATTTALVHALADYGHYAQICLSQVNDWIIGRDYAEMDVFYRRDLDFDAVRTAVEPYAIVKQLDGSDIENATFQVNLMSRTGIRVHFTPKAGYTGRLTAKVDGKDVALNQLSDGRYRVEVLDIRAHNQDRTLNIEVQTDSGTASVQVSVLSYVRAMLNKDNNKDYHECVSALYHYYRTAADYRAAHVD